MNLSIYKKALSESRVSFRKAVIYKTFDQSGIKALLSVPHFSQEVSLKLGLNPDATSRFLYAAASLGLITQDEHSGKFYLCQNAVAFCETSSLTLFGLIRQKIPDILVDKPKTLEQILATPGITESVIPLLEKAVEYNLLIRKGAFYSIPEENVPLLISTSPDYIGPMVEYLEKIAMPTFTVEFLIAALRSGQSQWQKYLETTSGEKVSHPFELYGKYPDLLEKFTFGLHKLNEQDNKQLVLGLAPLLDQVRTVLDIGGGSGCLALAIATQSTKITKIDIYELPEAIPILKRIYDSCSLGQANNINFIAGSFRESTDYMGLQNVSPCICYDAITLSWILHDWPDEVNYEILKKAYVHLAPQGKIIIIEAVLPESRLGDATIGDMTMLLHTLGRERTFLEYRKLLEVSGFKEVTRMSTNTSRQAIVACK